MIWFLCPQSCLQYYCCASLSYCFPAEYLVCRRNFVPHMDVGNLHLISIFHLICGLHSCFQSISIYVRVMQ